MKQNSISNPDNLSPREPRKRIYLPENQQHKNNLPGYPSYPPKEDIYNEHVVKEKDNPTNDISEVNNHIEGCVEKSKDFIKEGDLDVNGSELDDVAENSGSEDEENKYYNGAKQNDEGGKR